MMDDELTPDFEAADEQIAEPDPLPPEVQAGEGWVWATLGRDLDARGSSEARPFLPKQLKARHDRTVELAGHKVVGFTLLSRFSSYAASYDPGSGAQLSATWERLAGDPGMDMTVEEGIRLATETLQPPPEARLETAAYDQAGEEPFLVVRWAHYHEGVKVERDFLQAFINGKSRKIFSWRRRWHQVSSKPRTV